MELVIGLLVLLAIVIVVLLARIDNTLLEIKEIREKNTKG